MDARPTNSPQDNRNFCRLDGSIFTETIKVRIMGKIIELIFSVLIGGGLVALLGRTGQCSSGACLLTVNWKCGAVFGTALGLMFYVASGGAVGSFQTPKNIQPVMEGDFNAKVTHAGKPVAVDFFARWCVPCRMLSARLDKLATEFQGSIQFVSVNVDQAPALAAKFNVQGIPTLLFFGKDGKIAETSKGLVTAATLRAKLEALTGE